jgi:trigger factor
VIGEGQAPAQIDDALVGMNIGDEKVIDMGSDTEIEDNRLRFLITLKGVKERKLPDIDDEMAKDTGKYETLDALKADIEKRMLEARKRSENQRLRGALFKKLMEKNPMALPPSLVDRHAQALKNQLFGQMMSHMDETQSAEMLKGLEDSTRKSAEEMVHQHLLTLEIARLEDIEVDDDAIEKEVATRADAAGIPVPMLKAELNKENRRQELSVEILEQKIFEFVKSSVNIVEVEKLTAPKQDEGNTEAAASETKSQAAKAEEPAVESTDAEKEKETKPVKTVTRKKTEAQKSVTAKSATAKKSTKKSAATNTAAKKTATKNTAAKKSSAPKAAAKKAASNEE